MKFVEPAGVVLVVLCAICTGGVRYAGARPSPPVAQQRPAPTAPPPTRDGSHDFDFNVGTWHTHIRRLQHPLSGSSEWFEVDGTVRIRKVWNGKAQLEEIEADGPKGHWESMTLFLYNPNSRQWSLHFANSSDGTVTDPSTGEFHDGRGEFYSPDTFNGRAILTRQIWSKITPDSHQFEQAFSTDGGKTWETNFIANLTRADAATAAQHVAPPADGSSGSHDFDFALGTWNEKTRRMLHPLTGSSEWIEMNGQSVTRAFWNGRGNYTELESDGPNGHLELLALRLYNPEAKQWNLLFATSGVGVLGLPPTVGEFKDGRGEFYGGDTLNGRAILIRFTFVNLSPDTARSEQAFSADGGKTWETNWINEYTRVRDAADSPSTSESSAAPSAAQTAASRISAANFRGNTGPAQQSMDDAWFTGPMLANSANTLQRGHMLAEPYVYDVISTGSGTSSFGSRTYLEYGLFDRLTIGAIPVFGYNAVNSGLNSSHVAMGDQTILAQYGFTRFHEGSWVPTTAVMVQETFPTGKYDNLGGRPANGLGAGAYTTTVALNSQTYFWAPNGHILRMRLNASEAISTNANVSGVSVYGTGAAFHGHAKPGNTTYVDWAWEYSLKRSLVLALDATYTHTGNTRVTGTNAATGGSPGSPVQIDSGTIDAVGFAPAVEYSWKPNLGVLFGVRILAIGHNMPATVTPAIAINYFR
jgi:hypothetical protein